MKYYRIEPSTKKSVIEVEYYGREDGLRIAVETCWRWGEFKLNVPETEEELKEYLDYRGVELEEYNEDPESYPFLPQEDDEVVELEDYEFETLSTWDGCSEEHSVYAGYNYKGEVPAELEESILELLEEEGISVLWEDWSEIEGDHPLRGFSSEDCSYVIYNGVTIEECDERGSLLNEEE